jgi:hypothetical protein
MVAIDTDVFVLAFALHQDARQETNTRFLDLGAHPAPRKKEET